MRWSLVAMVLLTVGCAGRVAVDYSHEADFSAYQTFTLPEQEDALGLNDERVRELLQRRLPEQGLREVPRDEADLLVRHRFVETSDLDRGANVFWGLGTGTRGTGLGLGVSTPIGRTERTEFKLVLQMVDRTARQVVWQAESQRALDSDATAERRREWIRETVTEMLDRYPPADDEDQ